MNDTDKDLEELIKDVYRLAGVYGPIALRQLLIGYASTAVPDAQLSGRTASGAITLAPSTSAGTVTLTAEELAMCKRTHLDPADVIKTKAKAIADGVYPAAATG